MTFSGLIELVTDNQLLFSSLFVFSMCTFVATLVFVPWAILQIPSDYFAENKPHGIPWQDQHPIVRLMLLCLKNLLGYVLLLTGVAMLVLPGQGLLTILIAVLLIDFPGKYKFKRWLVQRKPILKSVNWLRQRYSRDPLILPAKPENKEAD